MVIPRWSRAGLLLTAAAVALVSLPALTATAAEPEEKAWEVAGSGWGHGVGMSQYGAYAMALDGASAAEILSHYYSGATVTDLSTRTLPSWWTPPYPVTVGLDQGQDTVTITATGDGASLRQGAGGSPVPVRSQGVTVTTPGSSCTVKDNAANTSTTGSCDITVTWHDDGGVTRVGVAGDEHAHGTVKLVSDGAGNVHVTLTAALEDYLRGIAELPGSWADAAQQAQVIAARNYTVRKVLERGQTGLSSCGGCQLFDTTRDQVYRGWTMERHQSSRWLPAVEATAGRVAIHPSNGLVFTAYYSSSTGGVSENNEDVWGSTPLPYLRSVKDPWSLDPEVKNPYAFWTRSVTATHLTGRLGWDTVTGLELVQGAPGAVLRATGTDAGAPASIDLKGDHLRSILATPSAFVTSLDGEPGGPGLAGDDSDSTGDDGGGTGRRFADIDGSVHADAIESIAGLGITKGCNPPDNTVFCPEDRVTRGQMAAFLHRAVPDLPASGEAPEFVDGGTVFDDDIAWLASVGVTKGCDDDRFCPERPVTRGEMAAFLSRAFGYTEVPEDDLFADDDGSVFEGDIERLAVAGVTYGCNPPDNSRFCPSEPVTRSQMASFLARALG